MLSSLTFHIQGITGHIFTDGIPGKTCNTFLVEVSVDSNHYFLGTSSFHDLVILQGPAIFNEVRVRSGRAGQLDTVALVDGLLVHIDIDTGGELDTDPGAHCPRHGLGLVDGLALQVVSCHVGQDWKCESGDCHEPGTEIIFIVIINLITALYIIQMILYNRIE